MARKLGQLDDDINSNYDWDSEQSVNWTIVGLVLTVILLGVAAFAYKEFTAKKILYIRADDVSKSGLEHKEAQEQHCKTAQRYQKAGDRSVVIHFADKPEIINRSQIKNQLDFTSCEINAQDYESLPRGTSMLRLFEFTQAIVNGYRAQGIDYPLVFTMTLDANEPVQGEFDSIEDIKIIADDLTKNGQIAIIGPSKAENLQSQLIKELGINPNIEVCPYGNVQECTEKAIKKARQ